MFLGIATLAVAVMISIVAAYYSILGLTAIFASVFWPVVIMGASLETGKVLTAVWLHRNWKRCSWAYKSYLVPALVFLMLLTSMGIFGFLSKAHLDQSVPSGDVAAQVSLIDEKIKNERENIANAQAVIKQMDASVNGVIASGDQEVKLKDGTTKLNSAAERSLQIRRSQAKDRATLSKQIEEAQQRIVALQEQKAPIASQLRKVEAEVGPIKYVAALIYGDNPDANTLERAVRWVIILIVLVFDPLAIVLILAGSKQIEWSKGINYEIEDGHKEATRRHQLEEEEKAWEQEQEKQKQREQEEKINEINSLLSEEAPGVDIDHVIESAKKVTEAEEATRSLIAQINERDEVLVELKTTVDKLEEEIKHVSETNSLVVQDNVSLSDRLQYLEKEINDKNVIIESLEQEKNSLIEQLSQLNSPKPIIEDQKLDFDPKADNAEIELNSANAGFGNGFPPAPARGDLFLRVDYLPSKLFRYNGTKWIEIDKTLTDSYTYNEKYIQHLIDRLAKGEYDADDLSDSEREQIAEYIKKNKDGQ